MAKISSIYICQQCGYQSPTFLGKCPECGIWNSLVEQVTHLRQGFGGQASKKIQKSAQIINISDIKKDTSDRLSSKIDEFDRVLGGGIVKGSLVLVSGDPGIGKSTLLTQLLLNVSRGPAGSVSYRPSSLSLRARRQETSSPSPLETGALYISGEESAQQIKLRVDRINKNANLAILNEVDVDVITSVLEQVKPLLVIVDSIQTLKTEDLAAIPGSISQVRESANRLQRVAKSLHIPIFLIGHVTKEGTLAGPKTLEHLVDVVLSLEGDPTSHFRVLRANKNRFGPTDEVGIFDMEEGGMIEVKNPSKLFLEQKVNAPGSCVIVTLTGLRPILLEIQALVTKTNLSFPRRVGTGVDNNRLQLLVAVLQKRLGLPLFDADIFVNATSGIRVFEPASDLGICMAIISSLKDKAIPAKTVFIGEVGLLGEIRAVRDLEKRITEAKKLGYIQVISPKNAKNLAQAVKLCLG